MPDETIPPLQKFVKLSPKGEQLYREVYISSGQTLLFWAFVGSFTGFTLTKLIPLIGSKLPANKLQKYKRFGFWIPIITFTYHGYKTSRRYKRKGMRQITKDPANVIDETQ